MFEELSKHRNALVHFREDAYEKERNFPGIFRFPAGC
jgi:hypothetical protein